MPHKELSDQTENECCQQRSNYFLVSNHQKMLFLFQYGRQLSWSSGMGRKIEHEKMRINWTRRLENGGVFIFSSHPNSEFLF